MRAFPRCGKQEKTLGNKTVILMSDTWTNNFKNLGGQWPSEDSARAVADSLQGLIGHFEYGGTLKAVAVCRISTKPASDPGFEVWGVRGTFETGSGAEVELWLEGPVDADDDDREMEEFTEALREVIDGMPAEWDRVGRLAVLFGACVHASGLGKEEARRALAKFEGATDWQNAGAPGDGEGMH